MRFIFALAFSILCFSLHSQLTSDQKKIIDQIQQKENYYGSIAKQIWSYPEIGYLENKSSALLQEILKKEGFKIEAGVAGIPTAFIATYGEGKPIIGILAEYDALPGLSQDSTAQQKAIEMGAAGHACGHHLFGVGSSAAAIAIKNWLVENKKQGIIRLYGTPAEEGGSGKVYMVREGLFNDVDVMIHWHPGSSNSANATSSLANKSGKFRFYGISAHAAGAPHRGRSALDGVESMNYMVNMMREHVPQESRIHYVITNGGKAPNVVPDFAEVYYYARHNKREVVVDIWNRLEKAAEGAALGTGTTYKSELIGGVYEVLPIEILARKMHENLEKVGGVHYTPNEIAFAQELIPTLGLSSSPSYNEASQIEPFKIGKREGGGSTDVGDVSWTVPTVGLRTATWVPGTPAHSWQAVAAGGMSIGKKGMIIAAKTMTLMAIELFSNVQLVEDAKKEFENTRGTGFKYSSLLGDRKPALEYRK